MINFGLENFLGTGLYFAAIVLIFFSLFRQPTAGLYALVPFLPLQTIRYRLNAYPLGGSFVGLLLLAVIIGLQRRGKNPIARTPWNTVLIVYCIFTFLSLCLGSLYLHAPLPFLDPSGDRFQDWREYILMPLTLFAVAAAVEDQKQMKIVILLMCFGALAVDKSYWSTVSGRDFSAYSDDLRDPGAMGYAGVNGLAAFEAQFTAFAIALASWERGRWLRIGYYALAAISALCLMFSLSRGGYIALGAGCLFLAVVKQRKLLIAMIVLGLAWNTILPKAVQERVTMTYEDGGLDHSSETRVNLWEDALRVFNTNIVTGTGFNTYAYMGRIGNYRDTHNYFIKVLVETGILGFALVLTILVGFLKTGWFLHRRAREPLSRAIGLGLVAWVICVIAVNCFGDRWTFLQVNGYMWVIAGLAARAWQLERSRPVSSPPPEAKEPEPEPVEIFEPPDEGIFHVHAGMPVLQSESAA